MKLLFITQKLDKEDGGLGFVHGWVEKLASKVDTLYVICRWEGQHKLPKNVIVLSLGAEKGAGKIKRFINLQKHLIRVLPRTRGVFVHMCPAYVTASFPLAKLFGKKIMLWFAHSSRTKALTLAMSLADGMVTSVPEGCPEHKNKFVIGQGIDLDRFMPARHGNTGKGTGKILFLGRISPIKKIHIIIDALKALRGEGYNISLSIVGGTADREEDFYLKYIKEKVKLQKMGGYVKFYNEVPNYKTPTVFRQNDLFINLTNAGCFDKATLEAMACGVIPVISSSSSRADLPKHLEKLIVFRHEDAGDLILKLKTLMAFDDSERKKLQSDVRGVVRADHNIDTLTSRILQTFEA